MITLRPATLADAPLLFAWRCDPETIKYSTFPPPTTREDHDRWLAETLSDPSRHLLIAEHKGMPVGTVRLDHHGTWGTELSLTVAPEVRGKGYGTAMIQAAASHASGRVIARVRGDNVGSLIAFLRAGFTIRGTVVLGR